MGVYIKGMRMPKQGYKHIVFCDGDKAFSLMPRNDGSYAESGSFEAFNIKPHGRLIDADELQRQFERMANEEWNKNIAVSAASCFDDAAVIVEDAPTVIEAEEGD